MRQIIAGLLLTSLLGTVSALADNLVFDRGLPTSNLNNVAGASRSNVAWADGDSTDPTHTWSIGDDFQFGTIGSTYSISTLRVWIVGDASDPLSTLFSSLSLFGGQLSDGVAGITTIADRSTSGDPNLSVSDVTYAGGAIYQGSSGNFSKLWQVDFENLNWVVNGGSKYMFFVNGPQQYDAHFNMHLGPFMHASNAALSGSTQDGADNLFRELERQGSSNVSTITWDSNGGGWDKSSDINVQVWASPVPEPSSVALLGTVLLGLGWAGRRWRQRRA